MLGLRNKTTKSSEKPLVKGIMNYNEVIEYIKHFKQYGGCVWRDKFTTTPYGIKDKYVELDDLLRQILALKEGE